MQKDIARDDLRDSLRAQVYDLTAKAGVDVVIDPPGGYGRCAPITCCSRTSR